LTFSAPAPTFGELRRRVRAQLGQDFRYDHSVRVARCADLLAHRHGLDARKARLAGMLHDLARLYAPERLVAECELRGMPIDAFERANPVVLHARLGAALAREQFGVRDDDVLSAIEKHTTAAGEMSPLDRTVYLADSLEPGRAFPERAGFWQLALRDLDDAMRAVIVHAVDYLRGRGLAPAPQTLAAARALGLPLGEVPASAI
jgi:predicted HD superfamily hydrolase involved in NAD metabolism